MNTPIAQLRADQVSVEERRRIAAFIGESEDSPVSILLRRLLTATDNSIDVTLLSDDSEVTPNQAAELLNMSRPHLLTFMDRGLLSFRRVGTHRRIKTADLIAFMHGREQGAAVVASALGNPPMTAIAPTPLSADELRALADL